MHETDAANANLPLVSVIIPVGSRHEPDQGPLNLAYRQALHQRGVTPEFVYVIDGNRDEVARSLENLSDGHNDVRIVRLAKSFGEATALTVGFEHARGEWIMTLPAHRQVEPGEVARLIDALAEADLAIGRRLPGAGAAANRVQSSLFHWLAKRITGEQFNDLACEARAFRRAVMEEIPIYGGQHRFLPILARRRGFHVTEVELSQPKGVPAGGFQFGRPASHLIDLLTVFFLVRFTKKPLRFFGLIGLAVFALGGVLLAWLVGERLLFDVQLADRPALLLTSLLVVLGIQTFALGLIGELIIFLHARHLKEYTVEEVVN